MNPFSEQPSLFSDIPPVPPVPQKPLAPPGAPPAGSPGLGQGNTPPAGAGTPPEETPLLDAEEGDELADAEEAPPTELDDWKEALRQDFEAWLASLEEIPEADSEAFGLDDEPDLYSFYEQFAAANAEARKSNRRTAEAFSQWSETLARFESSLAPLRETAAQLAAAQPKEAGLSRAHVLLLVELLDRMHRMARAFQAPPAIKKSWWGGGADAAWRRTWESQRQALDILVSHVEGLLKKEGVTRIDTVSRPFDPAVMMAISAEPDATRPPQTVLEELAAGYLRHGELLRAAQVKVSRSL